MSEEIQLGGIVKFALLVSLNRGDTRPNDHNLKISTQMSSKYLQFYFFILPVSMTCMSIVSMSHSVKEISV
jgi:hypothetical protein